MHRTFAFKIMTSIHHTNAYDPKSQIIAIMVSDKNHYGINSRIYKNPTQATIKRIEKIHKLYA